MRTWCSGAILAALAVMLAGAPATAGGKGGNDARRLYDEATAAFGLGRYANAAEKYEAAFAVRPDPALLYNAAQAYRLAGNKPRALELYRNYVRLYPDRPNVGDARTHVAALTRALDEERIAAATPPPVPATPVPVAATEAPPPPPAPAQASAPPPAALVAAPGPSDEQARPITRRPWFWAAVGAAVVGGTVAVLLATRGTTYPDASLGKVPGN